MCKKNPGKTKRKLTGDKGPPRACARLREVARTLELAKTAFTLYLFLESTNKVILK
jgi:hypothetical protein